MTQIARWLSSRRKPSAASSTDDRQTVEDDEEEARSDEEGGAAEAPLALLPKLLARLLALRKEARDKREPIDFMSASRAIGATLSIEAHHSSQRSASSPEPWFVQLIQRLRAQTCGRCSPADAREGPPGPQQPRQFRNSWAAYTLTVLRWHPGKEEIRRRPPPHGSLVRRRLHRTVQRRGRQLVLCLSLHDGGSSR